MKQIRLGIWLAPLLLLIITGCATPLKRVVPPEGRSVEGGRQLFVTVAQNEINASINESKIAMATGGGLLFALIDAGVNTSRAKGAEAAIVPVRNSLTSLDFEAKAMASAKQLVSATPWLGVNKEAANKDPSNERFSKALDDASNSQMLSMSYDYLLTPKFDTLRVGSNVNLLLKSLPNKPKAKGTDRAFATNAVFSRAFVCDIPLQGADKEREANAAKWSENGGAAAKQAIDQGLAKLNVIIKRGIELTDAQAKDLTKGKTKNINGYLGKVIDQDAEGTLIETNLGQWIYMYGFKGK